MFGDFSAQAKTYATARPGYPGELADVLLKEAGVQAGSSVAEIGAGTGIFTRLLVERHLVVTAVEPNQAMRIQAPALPGVRWIDGTFEETSLGANSQDWVVAAQAFHWADPQRALPEMRRILKTNRAFTVVWNNRRNEQSEVLQHTVSAIHRYVPEFDDNYRQMDWPKILISTGDFSRVVARAVAHNVPMSRERYLDLWRSHNRLTTMAGPERFAALLADIERLVLQQEQDVISVPYVCKAWTAW